MSRHEREAARAQVERAMSLGTWALGFAAGIRSALHDAGVAFVRAVTLS